MQRTGADPVPRKAGTRPKGNLENTKGAFKTGEKRARATYDRDISAFLVPIDVVLPLTILIYQMNILYCVRNKEFFRYFADYILL